MGREVVSISENLRSEPFELQVSRGQIPYHRAVTVFGYNPDVDTSEESVWPDGGTVPHNVTASKLKVSSTSANDTSAGTGARTVRIEGLNSLYVEISETVTLNGQTAVETANTYIAINNLIVLTVGSGGKNAGDINVGTGTVTAGVPAVLWDLIGAGFNQRTTGHYTVPADYTGYLVEELFTAGQASGSTGVTGKLLFTGPDQVTRVGTIVAINNGAVNYDYKYPIQIPEKFCVGATATGSANNNAVSSMFVILLIKNEQPYSSGA